MLTKRIIPCLDVKDGKVVKGVQFKGHTVVGEVLDLARRYRNEGADELVFYDISASAEGRSVASEWVRECAKVLDIPFCVAGGVRSVEDARLLLIAGADKISINSPALERPSLINELAREFGSQCVVVGIDSRFQEDEYYVYQYSGLPEKMLDSKRKTLEWAVEAESRGAGEIVLNCMNQDGVGRGYDLEQLRLVRGAITTPLIASGGAGCEEHFSDVLEGALVQGALAAGVFHRGDIRIPELKRYLKSNNIEMRI